MFNLSASSPRQKPLTLGPGWDDTANNGTYF